MGFFSIEGKFFRTLTKIGDFLILTVLGLVFSLPVVTIGASVTAMFYVSLKTVKDEEGYVWRSFWKSWKQNLKQSIIIEILVAILGFILVTDIRVCYQWAYEGSTVGRLLMFASFGFTIVYGAALLYVFPVLAKFDNKVLATIKNALILCMHHFPQTIVMVICTYGLIYFSLQMFPVFIFTIPLIFYINSYILVRIFAPYEKADSEEGIEDNTDNTDETGNE